MRKSLYPVVALGLVFIASQPAGARVASVDDVTLFADRTLLDARQYVRLRGANGVSNTERA